jgi:hypothetical protein
MNTRHWVFSAISGIAKRPIVKIEAIYVDVCVQKSPSENAEAASKAASRPATEATGGTSKLILRLSDSAVE